MFYLYIAVMFMLVIHGAWLYDSIQAERAARHGAIYLGTTNNVAQASAVANNYLATTQVFATGVRTVQVYWNSGVPVCVVRTEMRTFVPGLPQIFSSASPRWTDRIMITKEAVATGEHKFTNAWEYN